MRCRPEHDSASGCAQQPFPGLAHKPVSCQPIYNTMYVRYSHEGRLRPKELSVCTLQQRLLNFVGLQQYRNSLMPC